MVELVVYQPTATYSVYVRNILLDAYWSTEHTPREEKKAISSANEQARSLLHINPQNFHIR